MHVHHLFHGSDPSQPTLHQRITPTALQREQQQERWRDVRDYLVAGLADSSGYPMSSWLQGSYKFGTQIRPARKGGEFDIDLGIYFDWQGLPNAGQYSASELKHLVQEALTLYAEEAGDDVIEVLEPPKERCGRIRFSGDFHIDVPSYHLDSARDVRHLTTETKGWETSDPKAFFVWFHGLFDDDDHAQARRLIRYMKMWAALKLANVPSSVLLTVLVADAYLKLSAVQTQTDDVALRHVANSVRERVAVNSVIPNPVDLGENLNRLDANGMALFLAELQRLVTAADAAIEAPTEGQAAHIWTQVFGHFFPAAREQIGAISKALVPVAFDPSVLVQATPKTGAHTFKDVNRIGPIPKDCTINFTLQNAYALPAGARVFWVVRNEGEEAETSNDMGHVGTEGVTAEENSAYRGTHYMDVTATSALGVVLGSRRIPVQISGIAMPARNPKRPGWTRYGRK